MLSSTAPTRSARSTWSVAPIRTTMSSCVEPAEAGELRLNPVRAGHQTRNEIGPVRAGRRLADRPVLRVGHDDGRAGEHGLSVRRSRDREWPIRPVGPPLLLPRQTGSRRVTPHTQETAHESLLELPTDARIIKRTGESTPLIGLQSCRIAELQEVATPDPRNCSGAEVPLRADLEQPAFENLRRAQPVRHHMWCSGAPPRCC